jgi:hypothetical protein
VRFVLEHSVSPRLADALDALDEDHSFGHLRKLEGYPQQITDTAWLPKLASDHPDAVVITADPRITRGPAERAAWLEAGLTTFFLQSFAALPIDQQAWRLVKWWPQIVKRAMRSARGSGFLVTVNGEFTEVRRHRR